MGPWWVVSIALAMCNVELYVLVLVLKLTTTLAGPGDVQLAAYLNFNPKLTHVTSPLKSKKQRKDLSPVSESQSAEIPCNNNKESHHKHHHHLI